MLKNKNIIIGVAAGIACFKVVDLISNLRMYNLEIIMTKEALNLISPLEFERASGNKVSVNMFRKGFDYKDYIKQQKMNHISLADKADIIVIAPATANLIGKLANGIADDLLTTTVMASDAPVLVCPSMNTKMWQNPVVQENVSKLRKIGYYFVEPEYGKLACGYEGVGRLADIKKIKDEIIIIVENKDSLKGRKIIVTAGATSEEIDPVRVITNKSSGKTGVYIAEEFSKRGASVTLIHGNIKTEPKGKISSIKINNADELYKAIKDNIKNSDIIVHSAAVSDFTVKKQKKKISSNKNITLKLKKSRKIIKEIKKLNNDIFLVGFKAECDIGDNRLIEDAYKTLKESNCDLIAANDIGKYHFEGTNEVFLVDKNKHVKHLKKDDKRVIARQIVDYIIEKIK